MLAKRITIPTVFSGALALAALSGCSLQDYDALGAGKPDDKTEDTDDEETSEEPTTSSETLTSTAPESTMGPDASVDTEPDAGDTTTEQTSTVETSSSSTPTEEPTSSETPTTSEPVETTEEVSSEPPPPPAIVTEGNLIANSSFEGAVAAGVQPGQWQVIGSAASIPTTDEQHSGTRSWLTAGRTQNWEGPGINLLGLLDPGETYVARAWVRASEASTFHIVRKILCTFEGGVEVEDDTTRPLIYQQLSAAFSLGTEWVQLETPQFTLASLRDCEHHTFVLYFEGPQPGVSLYLDDVSIVAVAE